MKLSGSLPVIPTPFYDGRIDYDSLLRLFDHLFPDLDGYTLCGSTGESVSLSLQERRELMKFAVENTPADKTIVVKVDVIKSHPRYRKVVRHTVKFHAHDEGNTAGIGDTVRIVETRPLSKQKRWRLAEIVEKAR